MINSEAPTVEANESPLRGLDLGLLMRWLALGAGAALLRLILLDRLPLAEGEAVRAFAAWQAIQGQLGSSLAGTGSPLLGHSLALLFWVFGASDAVARIAPVVGGVALALTPALLARLIGMRAAFWAAILIAVSPLAVEASRVVDGSAITAALAMIVVASCARLLTDSPRWAPWTLALGLGLIAVHEASGVLALATAGLAALVAWTPSPKQASVWLASLRRGRGPFWFGVGVAVVVGTGALMDLGGLGTPFGPIWTDLGSVLRPAALPSRSFAALAAYELPLLALALVASVRAWRRSDRFALFLGEWTLLLLALSAAFEPVAPVLALLPVAPAALLAASVLAELPLGRDAYRLSGSSCAILALTALSAGALLVAGTQGIGGSKAVNPLTVVATAALVAGTLALWATRFPREERAPALVLLGAVTWAALTIGNISRLSYGGSPPGTELLTRETTDPRFRAAFRELTILASADRTRALVYDATTPISARWYGRSIEQVPVLASGSRRPIAFRDAPAATNAPVPEGERVPWKVESQVDRGGVSPSAIASWLLSRARLVDGKPRDIIIIQ